MDFLNATRAIEQFAYELMLWVLFYPLTIIKVVINPGRMMDYVAIESGKDEKDAFANAMRPALFLLVSLAIGALLVPFTPQEAAAISSSRMGKAITDSLMALLLFRMVIFTFFPITGAIIYDLFTPGSINRDTLRLPFAQQCYITAPYALVTSPCLVLASRGDVWAVVALGVAILWLIFAEVIFFRRRAQFNWPGTIFAAVMVFVIGELVSQSSVALLTM